MSVRLVAAGAVLVSAVVHLKLWLDGFRDLHVVGPAFLLNAVGGLVITVLLVAWRHWVPPLLSAGFGASTLGAFVVSATVGLFGVHERWVGTYVWAAAVAEAVALVAGLVLLAPFIARGPRAARRSEVEPQHRPAMRGLHLH